MQHGSAPSSLVTWAAESIPTPQPMQIVRVTVDMVRPVPVAPLTITTKIEREGRKIQLCAVSLFANGVEVVPCHCVEDQETIDGVRRRYRALCHRCAGAGPRNRGSLARRK